MIACLLSCVYLFLTSFVDAIISENAKKHNCPLKASDGPLKHLEKSNKRSRKNGFFFNV